MKIDAVPYEADYFGKKPESDNDAYIEFVNFMYQRWVAKDIARELECMKDDIHDLASCLLKIDLYYKVRNDYSVSRFVKTEIEYIFTVCRSLYDFLQVIAKKTWSHVKLQKSGLHYFALRSTA